MQTLIGVLDALAREALLFAAVGFLIGGLDDALIDLLWIVHRARMRFAPPPPLSSLPRPASPHRIAVFVAAWQESAVIAKMLRTALATIDYPDYRIYLGTYPNDPATFQAARAASDDPRVRIVVGERDGPTTKADNLNVLWRALREDDARERRRTDAVVLHDAEDWIHADELALHDALIDEAAVIQIPVIALVDAARWLVSGHYADEFAESHRATLAVRAMLGAGLPLAGVGCCIRADALERLAADFGAPFDAASLTEDYEMGLRLATLGFPSRFARVRGRDGSLVATRAYFPQTVPAAVRQKARWMTGIALAGWDRIGWGRTLDLGEHWMRMRDRRAPLAVLVLAAAWFGFVLWGVTFVLHVATGVPAERLSLALRWAIFVNGLLLLWRLAVRGHHTASIYGLREGLRAIPRMLVANFILLLAVRVAITRYVAVLLGGVQRWEKTEHVFPDIDDAVPR